MNPDGSRTINGRPEYVRSACDASLQAFMGVRYPEPVMARLGI